VGLDVPVQQVSWYPTSQDGTWRSTWETAEGAVGHHRNSANPGEAGNVVLSGHHNAYGEVFRDVSEIGLPGSPMDEGSALILVAQDGRQHTYSVLRWERFQVEGIPDAERGAYARYMAPSTDPILTVITCWPYDGNSHRVVVVAEFQATQ
jgi:LPXTG-site transpeptidase (sortase) family protein